MKIIIKFLKKIYHKVVQIKEKKFMDNLVSFIDFEDVKNEKLTKYKVITFVIPRMLAYSGGHTSILRLGTNMTELGYEVNYISYIDQPLEEMINNAKINLKNFKGNILSTSELYRIKSDVVIATYWESVFFVKKMNGYKMYFVQDYEPYFHLYGETFLFAKKTYELGLHMFSLGNWNKHMIEKNCDIKSEIDVIDFPYEKKEYSTVARDYQSYKDRRIFTIAVYVKNTGKRAPYLIQNILVNVKNEFLKDGLELDIKYYGEDKYFKCAGGENLGRLNKEELFDLYKNADFGMCASLSNISLVPYEMLATGLPLIEFEDGTYKHFLPENSAILISFNWRDLYNKIKEVINNPDIMDERAKNAYIALDSLSWQRTAKQYSEILNRISIEKSEGI